MKIDAHYKRQMIAYIEYLVRTCEYPIPKDGKDWIVVVPTYSALSSFVSILGLPVYIVDFLGSYDFVFSIPVAQKENRRWLKSFEDRRDEEPFNETYDYRTMR